MSNQGLASVLLVLAILLGCDNRGVSDGTLQKGPELPSQLAPQVAAGRDTDESRRSKLLETLVQRLEAGQNIAALMSAKFEFVFHADNRCDGNTDGRIRSLSAALIDAPIHLQVTNDGQAWLCETRAPSTFEIEFDLKARLLNWDRFEATLDVQNTGSALLEGAGQSDYLVIWFSDTGGATSIRKIEYRSEDPG